MVAGRIGPAITLIETDSTGSDGWLAERLRVFEAGAAGTRGMLAAIARSMMSGVTVTFSMTLVGPAPASSQ